MMSSQFAIKTFLNIESCVSSKKRSKENQNKAFCYRNEKLRWIDLVKRIKRLYFLILCFIPIL